MWQHRRNIDPGFLIAIVIVPDGSGGFSGKKYVHNIKDTDHYKNKFCNDMKRKFADAIKVNFYIKKTGEFLETIHLE